MSAPPYSVGQLGNITNTLLLGGACVNTVSMSSASGTGLSIDASGNDIVANTIISGSAPTLVNRVSFKTPKRSAAPTATITDSLPTHQWNLQRFPRRLNMAY
jgi:hypothetical protein